MKIFETHAHYDDEKFDEDREELLKSLPEKGIVNVVNIGANMETSRETVWLSNNYEYIYGAVGVHPNEVGNMTRDDIQELKKMTESKKIVAIGEIGLDYYYDEPPRDIQKKWFIEQAELARELELPMVIHSRDAAEDTVNIMKQINAEEIGGVVHCFSYSKELAEIFIKMGFYIGIGGVVTFQNSKNIKEVVANIPLERIVLETDSPYLAPVPFRGKRNSSLNLPYVVEKIAELKGITAEEVENVTYENALKLYRLK